MAGGFRHLPEKISPGPQPSSSRKIPIDQDLHPSLVLGRIIVVPSLLLLPGMIAAEGDRDVMVIRSPVAPQEFAVTISLVTVFPAKRIAGARDLRYPDPQSLVRVFGVDQESSHNVLLMFGWRVRITAADDRGSALLASTVLMKIDVVRRGRGDPIRQAQAPAVEIALNGVEDVALAQIGGPFLVESFHERLA